MPSEKWQRLMREYGSLHGELGPEQPVRVDVSELTVEDLKRLKEEAKAAKEQRNLDELFHFVYSIQAEFYGSGSFRTPIPNLFSHQNKARTLTVSDLKAKIEDFTLKIERLIESITALDHAVFRDEIKEKAESYAYSIPIKYEVGSRSSTQSIRWSEYNDLAALTREKLEVLKEAIKFHRKIKRAYENELKRRTISKDEFTDTIKKAGELCKEAEKCREKIVKANEKATKTTNAPDFETAKDFVENSDRFHILQKQYYNLIDKTRFFTDQLLNFPTFPRELTVDETSRKTMLKQAYKSERMRLERQKLKRE